MAAYFAARGACLELESGRDGGGPLCVWCLASEVVDREHVLHRSESETPIHKTRQFDLVSVPGWGNPNLTAQRGAFTLDIGDSSWPPRRSIEDVLATADLHLAVSRPELGEVFQKPWLHRMDLPAKQAPALLYLLWQLGYTNSRVMPGLAGVAEDLWEYARVVRLLGARH